MDLVIFLVAFLAGVAAVSILPVLAANRRWGWRGALVATIALAILQCALFFAAASVDMKGGGFIAAAIAYMFAALALPLFIWRILRLAPVEAK